MLKAVGDHTGVINAGLLIEAFLRVVLADDDCEITGRVKKNLIATDSKDRFHGNRFTMTR
ncbi:hypothetical protein SBA5_220140 [Candidatus Sulfotelmatomonas gaucii]|uniref:Uncharacterized protein n=1 Tax=Candidatus Sulfuritelmatomonas gaucii TaxID=2043161 RepID=A0A2N9L8D4_9BACT|nr:hypothetical protein SBA5_220140 [Candidatus Sulfotelmatomonas gaucii]